MMVFNLCKHKIQYGEEKEDFKLIFVLEVFDEDGKVAVVTDTEGNDCLYSPTWEELEKYIKDVILEEYEAIKTKCSSE